MARLILTVGTSGSGKSEWATNMAESLTQPTYVVDRDYYRYSGNYDWSHKSKEIREIKINKYITRDVINHLKDGYHVIITDTNLSLKSIEHWQAIAISYGDSFETVIFNEKVRAFQADPWLAMDAPEYIHTQCKRLNNVIQYIESNEIHHSYAI